jgi:uncharacterized protein YjbJ (UPF0337 family)
MGENMDKAKGKVKESVGGMTGDKDLQAEGKVDQLKGSLEGVKDKVKDAIDDIKDAAKKA